MSFKMEKSRIFTRAELEEMEKRKKGDRSDKTGIFCSRVKPKIIELFDVWFPQKKALKKTIEAKK